MEGKRIVETDAHKNWLRCGTGEIIAWLSCIDQAHCCASHCLFIEIVQPSVYGDDEMKHTGIPDCVDDL
jgi:hypothetical protein